MIKEIKMIPEYYIKRIAYCDDCGKELINTGSQLLSCPLKVVLKCKECNKYYHISENELQDEWKLKPVM